VPKKKTQKKEEEEIDGAFGAEGVEESSEHYAHCNRERGKKARLGLRGRGRAVLRLGRN